MCLRVRGRPFDPRRARLFFIGAPFFFHFFLLGIVYTVCGFTPDDLYIGPHVLQSCYCCTTCLYRVRHVTAVRRICMYLACIMYTECSCSVCCYCCCGSYFIATAACCYFPPSSAGWQKMLLCNLIPVRYFSSFKHD